MILFCKLTITSILKHFSKQKTYETNDGIFAFSHIFCLAFSIHYYVQNAKCFKIIKVFCRLNLYVAKMGGNHFKRTCLNYLPIFAK